MSGDSTKHWFWNSLNSFLERNNLKQTRQRSIVIKHFLRLDRHVDAEDLYVSIRKAGHNIGLATIYRTLNLLKDADLVEQRTFADGRAVYEVRAPHLHHDHLICNGCGIIIEFENEEIERLQRQVAEKYDFTLISHRLDLFGFCPRCRREQGNA